MSSTTSPTGGEHRPPNLALAQLPRALVGRRWWWVTLLVLVAMVIMARLGIWQLNRLEQRQARNAEYLAQIAQPPLVLDGGPLPAEPADLRDRLAQVTGEYDFSHQIVLTQQRYNGSPGAHLVTPFRIGDSESAILVDRGWISASELLAGNLERFDEAGRQMVLGALQLSQTLSGGRETRLDGPQDEWYRIDITAIQKQVPYDLLPLYLLVSPPEGIQETLPYRVSPDIDLTDGPHLSYAIQWFLFTVILGLGYLRFVSTHHKR